MQAYQKTIEQLCTDLNTSINQGLTTKQQEKNLQQYGSNILRQTQQISPRKIFFEQFKSFLIGILIFSALISFFVGEYGDAIVILIIIITNAILGFIQEYNAEKSLENLKKMTHIKCKVMREGKEIVLNAEDLVVGDVLLLEAGDKVGADARLFEVHSLETSEGILTGESLPIIKDTKKKEKEIGLGDQSNMVFSGTSITKGTGKAIITAVGMQSEIGKIAGMLQETPEKQTKLQEDLDILGKRLGIVILGICAIIFVVNVFVLGNEAKESFLTAISLSVAAIPEGLPAVVTIALGIGVKKLAEKQTIIKKLGSVETLGAVNIICTDKTGTLTQNEMTVTQCYTDNTFYHIKGSGYKIKTTDAINEKSKNLETLFRIGILCNNSGITHQGEIFGDPTEVALLVSGEKYGLGEKEEKSEYQKIEELPFDSERKLMSVIVQHKKETLLMTKGAPEELLKKCTHILTNKGIEPFTEQQKNIIEDQNKSFAENALRVLGFAYKKIEKSEYTEDNLIFVGLQAMIDPPREEVKDSIKICKEAGIKVIMITGDNKITAQSIANELGIEGEAITGEDLEKMTDKKLKIEIKKIGIFARVSPQHKQRIVKILQQEKNIVAMTGDGVNDAPALKHAHIGLAMGITGTEVAKEASDMILVDDNFTTIVHAIEEGRGIYSNIKKFVNVMLATNFAEIFIITLSIILKLPLPLIAIQILWVNLVSDGLPALALGVDPYDPEIMKKKPRKIGSKIIDKEMIISIAVISTVISLASIGFFQIFKENLDIARTGTFMILILLEFISVFIVRADYEVKFLSNKRIFISIIGAIVLTFGVIYIPQLANIFKLTALTIQEWKVIVCLGGISIIILCGYLFIKKHLTKNQLTKNLTGNFKEK